MMKFSIKDYFSKCDQIHSFLQIWSHLLKKSLMEGVHFLYSDCELKKKHFSRSHLNMQQSFKKQKITRKKKLKNQEIFIFFSYSLTISGITKPCTHLHPAPSTSIQLHPASFTSTQLISTSNQLHPPPPSSFQSPPSSLQHPQQYLNQNIAPNWAIFPNLGQKIKNCPF